MKKVLVSVTIVALLEAVLLYAQGQRVFSPFTVATGGTTPLIHLIRANSTTTGSIYGDTVGAGIEDDTAAKKLTVMKTTGNVQVNDAATDRGFSFYVNGRNAGVSFGSATNCADSAGAAACGSAAAGAFVIDAASSSTVVSTTAVTANSEIFVMFDSSLGTRLSVTCNTAPATVAVPTVTARTAGTSFTVSITGTVAVNPACFNYWIVN